MNFEEWADSQFISKANREDFKNWLDENGFSLTVHRRNEEWGELWRKYMKDKFNK